MSATVNKISVVFRISGLWGDLTSLTSILSSLNVALVRRPHLVPRGALPEAWWAIEVIRNNQESTDPVISEVLDRLDPLRASILSIADDPRFRIELDCTVEVEQEWPVLEISSLTLGRIAYFKAALGFEVHDYSE